MEPSQPNLFVNSRSDEATEREDLADVNTLSQLDHKGTQIVGVHSASAVQPATWMFHAIAQYRILDAQSCVRIRDGLLRRSRAVAFQ